MRSVRRGAATGSAIIGMLAIAIGLAGCAPGGTVAEPVAPAAPLVPLAELEVLDDPRSYVGGATAVLPDAVIEPVLEHPQQTLPTQVVSAERGGDRTFTIADTSRVIGIDLAGSVAATIWGLGFGDTLVGRDQTTTFAGAADLPLVTSGSHSVNAESIIALRPTLVITDGTLGPRDVIEQLRDVGIQVVFVENEASFEGAERLARDIAAIYGAPEAGDLLAARIADEVATTKAAIAAIAPDPGLRMVLLYLRGTSGIYYLFGEESGADVLIDALGGIDIAGELGWQGMQPLTDEALVAADPELIIVMTEGLHSVGGVDGLVSQLPAIGLTTAGRHQRIVDMADGQLLSFGPRGAGVIDALARAIYAPDAT